jgi:hypothetical protein
MVRSNQTSFFLAFPLERGKKDKDAPSGLERPASAFAKGKSPSRGFRLWKRPKSAIFAFDRTALLTL